MTDDAELIRRYTTEKSGEAFAELVHKHVDFVYAAALRQLAGDTHLAQDVTQTVFTDLARKAASLAGRASLAGWLYLGAHHAAAAAVRSEQRRHAREQEAHLMHELTSPTTPAADWERVRPVLDAAIQELDERDREAVLLRFFRQQPFAEIGRALGLSEDAARMRTERALDKLHALLARRGIGSTAAALAAALASQPLVAAPAGLATTVIGTALASAAIVPAATTGGGMAAAKILGIMSTTKLTLGVAAVVIVAAGAFTYQQHQTTTELRAEVATLREQQTTSVAALKKENERLVAAQKATADNAQAEHDELVQLRTARDNFRKQLAAQGAGRRGGSGAAGGPSAGSGANSGDAAHPMVPVDVFQNVGNHTPSATAQTLMWAMQHGDVKQASSLLTFNPGDQAKLQTFIQTLPENIRSQYSTPEELMAFAMSGSPRPIASVQLIGQDSPSDTEMVHHVDIKYQDGQVLHDDIKFVKGSDDNWKQVVSTSTVDRVIAYFQGKK